MTGTLNKGSLVKGTGGSGGGGSFPIIVTDSGSSLPSASGYQLNDTFLNTTDKKIYKTKSEGYELNTGISVTGSPTIDYTTGVVSGLNAFNNLQKTNADTWSGTRTYDVHFKFGETTFTEDKYYPIFVLYAHNYGVGRDIYIALKNKKLYLEFWRYGSGVYTLEEEHLLFDYEIQFDTEYYLRLSKNLTTTVAELSTSGYDGTKIATNTITTVDDFYNGNPTIILINNSAPNGLYPLTLSIYLADTTGNWLIPSTTLSWDNGTSLTDKTEYADKTNGALYLYENSELVKIGGSLTKKVYTISADNTSTLDVSSDFTKIVDVLKNGVELALTDDYTISSAVITFVTALSTTDKITVKGE